MATGAGVATGAGGGVATGAGGGVAIGAGGGVATGAGGGVATGAGGGVATGAGGGVATGAGGGVATGAGGDVATGAGGVTIALTLLTLSVKPFIFNRSLRLLLGAIALSLFSTSGSTVGLLTASVTVVTAVVSLVLSTNLLKTLSAGGAAAAACCAGVGIAAAASDLTSSIFLSRTVASIIPETFASVSIFFASSATIGLEAASFTASIFSFMSCVSSNLPRNLLSSAFFSSFKANLVALSLGAAFYC